MKHFLCGRFTKGNGQAEEDPSVCNTRKYVSNKSTNQMQQILKFIT